MLLGPRETLALPRVEGVVVEEAFLRAVGVVVGAVCRPQAVGVVEVEVCRHQAVVEVGLVEVCCHLAV